ncbi:MAG TPA: 3-keto-5-aminohexanoate cleavage protein [Pyrinomonadaceae bacterium]|jgi:uncharacterized protein (DUF849 family)
MLLKAAINGGRTKAEHPAVPVTPDEQAAAVIECVKAGAQAIHLHVRSVSGAESLNAEDVSRTLLAVRSASSTAQIGVSTGAWILPDPAARLQAVAAWEALPDFASVNFSEMGSVELAQLLLSRGVGVEAGLCDAEAGKAFLKSGLVPDCIRVLLEPQEQVMEKALQNVKQIERVLESATAAGALPFLLHGTETTVWPMMTQAMVRGYGARIGFEDTLLLPNGRVAQSNGELVREAVQRIKGFGLEIADY